MSATVQTVDEPDRSTNRNGVTEFAKSNVTSLSGGEVMTEIEMKTKNLASVNGGGGDDESTGIEIKNPQLSNWVKFDDDDNSSAIVSNKTTLSNSEIDSVAAKATTTATAATTTKPPNVAPSPPAQNAKTAASQTADVTPAVLATESIHINLDTSSTNIQKPNTPSTATASPQEPPKNPAMPISTPAPMRTIELSTGRIREGFANGDVIVTLLPTNTKWPWITPAIFRPELVPEELMAQGLTLTVEEYVNAMETLVNDYRFTVYNICYKRVLVCWILFAFCVLLALLFSGLQGIALFSLGVGWLFLNAAAIFLCMWIKLRLARGLEKCLARVNKQLIRHKILLILDDRGRISCHKVNLCFLYFDPAQCVAYLNDYVERSEQNGTNIQAGWEAKLDLDVNDIVIQGSNPVRLSRKQERAALLYLRYASRWGNEIVRGLGDVSVTEPARHCANFICACQFIERHLSCKPRGKSKLNIIYWVLASERYEN